MTAILETRGLNKHFGGLHVTNDVDFALEEGEVHCLIGPNGAGKSTFFRLLIGEYTPERGQVLYRGEDITALKPFERVRRGLSVKFQVPGIFPGLTVAHNLEIALQHHLEGASLGAEIRRLLAFLNLADSAGERAGTLSHGQKQWLEIGMAISLKPRLLLLDEPTAGMSPAETFATGEMVQALNRDGVAILAIEHDMAFVREIAEKISVMHLGKLLAEGTIAEIESNQAVRDAYLGSGWIH